MSFCILNTNSNLPIFRVIAMVFWEWELPWISLLPTSKSSCCYTTFLRNCAAGTPASPFDASAQGPVIASYLLLHKVGSPAECSALSWPIQLVSWHVAFILLSPSSSGFLTDARHSHSALSLALLLILKILYSLFSLNKSYLFLEGDCESFLFQEGFPGWTNLGYTKHMFPELLRSTSIVTNLNFNLHRLGSFTNFLCALH